MTARWSDVDKIAEIGLLLDIYGSLLTEKEKNILDLHYNYDLSFGEIAEQLMITRQAVYDSVKRGEFHLYELNNKLHLLEQHIKKKECIEGMLSEINAMQRRLDDMRVALENMLAERG